MTVPDDTIKTAQAASLEQEKEELAQGDYKRGRGREKTDKRNWMRSPRKKTQRKRSSSRRARRIWRRNSDFESHRTPEDRHDNTFKIASQ